MLTDDDLVDEIEEAISDSLDMDWQPKWAAPAILKIIHRERINGARMGIEAAKAETWREIATSDDAQYIALVRDNIAAIDPEQVVERHSKESE